MIKVSDKGIQKALKEAFISDKGVVALPADLYKSIMLITAGCGRGKTTFALSTEKGRLLDLINKRRRKNSLMPIKDIEPHELWFVVPRKAIKDQQIAKGRAVALTAADYSNSAFESIENRDKPRIATAHNLGDLFKQQKIEILPKIIVIDELHSVFTETTFAENLLNFIDGIENNYEEIIKVGLTATPHILENYIKPITSFDFNRIDIDLGSKYLSNKIQIAIGGNAKSIVNQMTIDNNNKVIVYKQSAKGCYNSAKEYGESAEFLISDYNDTIINGKEIVEEMKDKGVKDYIIKSELLPQNINLIFMNSALREGMNIEDSTVKTVICEAPDMITIQQVLGRIRGDLDNFIVVPNLRYQQLNEDTIKDLAQFYEKLNNATTEEEKQNIMKDRYKFQKDNNKSTIAVYETVDNIIKLNPYAKPYTKYIEDCYLQLKHSEKYYDTLETTEHPLLLCEDYFRQLQRFSNNPIEFINYSEAIKNTNHNSAIDRFKAIESQWIDKPLTAAQKKELSTILAVIRDNGKAASWNTVKELLENSGYNVRDTQRRIEGKRKYVSIITKSLN